MKKIFEKIYEVFLVIVVIAISPFVLLYQVPWMIKAFFRYISDKDEDYSFSDHLTDVRRGSKSFNKRWREAASKGINLD